MQKIVPLEKKLRLENAELRRSNLELQAQLLQTRLVAANTEYQKANSELDVIVSDINEEMGIDISKYRVNEEGIIVDRQNKPVEFDDQPVNEEFDNKDTTILESSEEHSRYGATPSCPC